MECIDESLSLSGYSYRYDNSLADKLNLVISEGLDYTNIDLKEWGNKLSNEYIKAIQTMDAKTSDNYRWFGALEFNFDSIRMKVLFPWRRDMIYRSVEVFSDVPVPPSYVKSMLDRIAQQIPPRDYKKRIGFYLHNSLRRL